jgi:hypothetical protein
MKLLTLLFFFAFLLPIQAPPQKRFTKVDLAKLRWIEGTWRGTGDVDKPFFERYTLEETALVTVSYTDETLSKVEDFTRFELKDGVLGNGGEESRWAASAIDDTSVTFVPVTRARNSFRFQRESDHSWQAVLTWPATDTAPARQKIYRMEPWPQKRAAVPAQPDQSPPEQAASAADDVVVPIIDETGYKGFCSTRLEPGPVVDEETFEKAKADQCFSFMKKLAVDFSKQSLIAFHVQTDCRGSGGIRIMRNDRLKKYTLWVTKYYGGCRAAGSYQGWVVIEKLRPDYAITSIERSVDGLGPR